MSVNPQATVQNAPTAPGPLGTLVERVIVFQISCQLALLLEMFAPLRVLIRSSAYGVSLVLAVWLFGRGRAHPAAKPALVILAIVGLGVFHPATNTLLAAAGQVGMYAAILGPLFWVPACRIDARVLRRLLLILFLFHTLSATFGVLQTYFPGRFMPTISTAMAQLSPYYIQLASGEWVLRPMGLTDFPGGAATAGFYAALLGASFLLSVRSFMARAGCLAGIGIGLTCIYLSQLRSILVLTVLCFMTLVGLLTYRGRVGRAAGLGVVAVGAVVASFLWAASIGGEAVSRRTETLFSGSPGTVYQSSRGAFLEATVSEVAPKYPLGAGLGRWGMMNNYFGDNSDPETASIWVEIQWTGWIIDGGIPLLLAYSFALGLAFWVGWRILRDRQLESLWLYASVILAYDVGALALTFNNAVFHSQMGLELWLLNAALFTAYTTERYRFRMLMARQAALTAAAVDPSSPASTVSL